MARAKKNAAKAVETPEVKAPEVEAPVAEAPAAKAPKAWMNRVPDSFIHQSPTKPTVSTVSIPDKNSETGFGTVFVSNQQMIQSTRRDGTPLAKFKNVNLGNPERDVDYSIVTGKGEDGKNVYETKKMKAADIAKNWLESQQDFYAQRQAEAKEAAEVAKEAEADGPEVG